MVDIEQNIPEAFLLGIHLEEVYSIFIEVMQVEAIQRDGAEYMPFLDRKLNLVKSALETLSLEIEFGNIDKKIRQIIKNVIENGHSDIQKKEFSVMATTLDNLMNNLGAQLKTINKIQFEIGIFIARISLCCRYIKIAQKFSQDFLYTRINEIYLMELKRVGNLFAEKIQIAKNNATLETIFPKDICALLVNTAQMFNKTPDLPINQITSLRSQVEIIFDKAGFN